MNTPELLRRKLLKSPVMPALNVFLFGKEMQQDEMKKIIDDYIKSYNSFDIDGMLGHMHKDISFQNISDGQVNMSTHGISE